MVVSVVSFLSSSLVVVDSVGRGREAWALIPCFYHYLAAALRSILNVLSQKLLMLTGGKYADWVASQIVNV